MADPVLIAGIAGGPAPLTYVVPPGLAFKPTALSAVFNGASATSPYLACLSFYTQDGKLMARTFPETPVPIGGSAEVTYSPF